MVPVESQKPFLLYTFDAWQLLAVATYLDEDITTPSDKLS